MKLLCSFVLFSWPFINGFAQVPEGNHFVGVITLGPKFSTPDTITLYNKDGSPWYRFSYKYDDSDGKYDFYNPEFAPLGFHPDYFSLELRVVSINDQSYEVVVNEASGLTKFVFLEDGKLKLVPFEEYILSEGTILFDLKTNPILQSIDGSPVQVKRTDFEFHPIKFDGEWLMIRFKDLDSKKSADGWIRWKKSGRLMIELTVD